MYNDMATGVAEGTVIFPTAHGGGYKFYEVAPYWTVVGFGAMNQNIFTMNADTAAKLPADVMKIIEEEAQVYSKAVNEDVWAGYTKGLEKLVAVGEEKGLKDTVYYLPMEEKQKWADLLAKARFRKKNVAISFETRSRCKETYTKKGNLTGKGLAEKLVMNGGSQICKRKTFLTYLV